MDTLESYVESKPRHDMMALGRTNKAPCHARKAFNPFLDIYALTLVPSSRYSWHAQIYTRTTCKLNPQFIDIPVDDKNH